MRQPTEAGLQNQPGRICTSLSRFTKGTKAVGKWRGKTRAWPRSYSLHHLVEYEQFCCFLLNLFTFKLPSLMAELNKLRDHMSEFPVQSLWLVNRSITRQRGCCHEELRWLLIKLKINVPFVPAPSVSWQYWLHVSVLPFLNENWIPLRAQAKITREESQKTT